MDSIILEYLEYYFHQNSIPIPPKFPPWIPNSPWITHRPGGITHRPQALEAPAEVAEQGVEARLKFSAEVCG